MKRLAILFCLLPVVVFGGITEDAVSAYELAQSAMDNLKEMRKSINFGELIDEINEEADRLEVEAERIKRDADELQTTYNDAISSFSSLSLDSVDTSNLTKAYDTMTSAADSYGELAGLYHSLAAEIKGLADAANSWDVAYASWEWIIEHYVSYDGMLPYEKEQFLSKLTHCTVSECACMQLKYAPDDYNRIYKIISQNLGGWVYNNGNWEQSHGDIP